MNKILPMADYQTTTDTDDIPLDELQQMLAAYTFPPVAHHTKGRISPTFMLRSVFSFCQRKRGAQRKLDNYSIDEAPTLSCHSGGSEKLVLKDEITSIG